MVSCLLLVTIACSGPTSPGETVAAGTWGGDHARLDVTADGGRIEYDCAHGALAEPLTLDGDGRFTVTGTHTPEHGGPVRDNETLPSRPARYAGRIQNGRMTLAVTLTDTGERLNTLMLTQGSAGRLFKCL